jgi:hypothetical protein
MKHANRLVVGIGMLSAFALAHAQVLLVSEEEMRASNNAPFPEVVAKSPPQPDAPKIELLLPDTTSPVATPTKISLRFQATAPAEPKPESFKVFYGAFGLDITTRLLGLAKVTKEGIQVDQVSLPKGSHKLSLFIEDSAGRSTRQILAFSVN